MSIPSVVVDTAHLKQVGLYHLRGLADHHLTAANLLDAVEYLRPQLFLSPCSGESGLKSRAYPKWLELYSMLQSVMQSTVTNLTDIGDAVVKAADGYAAQDLSTAEQLLVEEQMDTYANGDDAGVDAGFGSPPSPVGEPPAPNDTPDIRGKSDG